MSSIIDFFVAADDDEAAGARDSGPRKDFETVTYGNFDAWTSIAEWASVLTGDDDLDPRSVAGEGDLPVVLGFPPALTAALAAADAEALSEATTRWLDLRAEEGEDIDEELAEELLIELAALATEAVGTAASLYCWIG